MDQSTDLQLFIPPPGVTAERGYQLTVIMRDGDPWFVARDVAGMLGLGDPRSSLRSLDDDERGEHSMPSPSGEQRYNIINESGLYSLILRSRRPEARIFKKWITSEVLPSIRKTGAYGVQRELSRRELLTMALEAEDRAEGLTRELEAAAPAVNGYNTLINAHGDYSLASAAQAVSLGRGGFIALLGELKAIIVRPGHSDHLRPYQDQIHAGRFHTKLRTFDVVKDGITETRTEGTTMVTPKGIAWVVERMRERSAESPTIRHYRAVTGR